MLRDITLGQYYPADSILHRLDPRVKFVGTLVYVISLFLFHNWGYLLGTVFLAVMIKLSKVPFKFITKGLKSIFVLLAITMVFNILFTPGEVLVRIWKITITREGCGYGMPYVGASDFPDDRLFADDADDNTEPADGCTRKPARTIEKNPCAGA